MNYSELIKDNVLVVGLEISEDEYLLWQLSLDDENDADVYFEFNDQLNGGYNNIKELCLMRDGIHVVMKDDSLEHFYFDKKFDDYARLASGLKKIYKNSRSILDVLDP